MPPAVVDLLEIVQVHIDHGQWPLVPCAQRTNPLPFLEEGPDVHQPGEAVGTGKLALEGVDQFLPADQLHGDDEEDHLISIQQTARTSADNSTLPQTASGQRTVPVRQPNLRENRAPF